MSDLGGNPKDWFSDVAADMPLEVFILISMLLQLKTKASISLLRSVVDLENNYGSLADVLEYK